MVNNESIEMQILQTEATEPAKSSEKVSNF